VETETPVFMDLKDVGYPERAKEVRAHLIESISFGGESGSPVFLYQDYTEIPSDEEMESIQRVRERRGAFWGGLRRQVVHDENVHTPLLGMISSHWKIDSEIRSGQKHRVRGTVGLNSGIATVIPAREIREFLVKNEHVKKHREGIPKRPLNEPTTPLSVREAQPEFKKVDFEPALKKASKHLGPSQSDEEN
jgi:hypothetical protein